MATKQELLAEAYRRNLLPDDKKVAYETAIKRRLVNAPPDVRALADARKSVTGGAPASKGRNIDRAYAVSQGMSLGFMDELAALSQAGNVGLRNLVGTDLSGHGRPGYSAKEAYDATMKAQAERRNAYAAAHPVENVAMQIGGGLVTGGAGAGLIKSAPTAGTAVARAAAVGAGYGAVAGAGNADGGLINRAKGAGVGAGVGVITAGGTRALGSGIGIAAKRAALAAPTAARQLANEGVLLTPGQMAGGIIQRAEDAATSVPILGDSIRGARIRGIESFNRAAVNRALAPIGETLPPNIRVGRDGVREATDRISNAYKTALAPVKVTPDAQLTADLARVAAKPNLPPAVQAELKSVLDDVTTRASGTLDGDAWKVIDADLGAAIRSADTAAGTQPSQRLLRDALQDARGSWRTLLERADPNARAAVAKADEATANLVRIREAAQKVGARDGMFTASHLNSAVRSADSSAGNRAFAQGDALMQDLTGPAMAVLPSTVPDSGTPFRSLMTTAGLSGGGMAVGADAGTVGTIFAGLGLSAGAYSAPVQRVVNEIYRSSSPGAARAALAQLTNMAAENPALRPLEAKIRERLARPASEQGQ